jgi:hypothetical protein
MALRPGDRKTQAILAGVIFAGFLQERLHAVRLLEMTVLPRGRAGDRDEFEVVTPHLESWGRHELSVIYRFRFGPSVDLATRRLLAEHLPSALAAALGTSGVVLALLRRMA